MLAARAIHCLQVKCCLQHFEIEEHCRTNSSDSVLLSHKKSSEGHIFSIQNVCRNEYR